MARLLEEQRRTLAQQPVRARAGQIQKPGTAQPQNTTRQPAEQQQTRQGQPAELHTGTDKDTARSRSGSGAQTTVGAQQGSDVVAQAQAALNQQLQQFRGSNSGAIGDLVGQIMNRQPFEYDVGADPTYQALREIWTRDGLMAMEDTMGQAAQLTGGYGNSHAQTTGQQVYQGYLRGLNEMIPELKQAAQADYDAQTNALLQQYGILMEQDSQEYARYLDALEKQYREGRDAVEDARYEQEWAYQQSRDELDDQRYAEEWARAMQQDERDYALQLALAAYEMGDDSLVRALGIEPEEYVGSSGGYRTADPKQIDTPVEDKPKDNDKITDDGNRRKNPQVSNFEKITAGIQVMLSGGASADEIKDFLYGELVANTISEAQYQTLMRKFFPPML